MSHCSECELLKIERLIQEYLETHSEIILNILEVLLEQDVHSLDLAINEVLAQY